jgi:hypothetical protein
MTDMNENTGTPPTIDANQIGNLFDRALFMQHHIGTATDGDAEYMMGFDVGSCAAILTNTATSKVFVVTWHDIIALAQQRGIDEPIHEEEE